VIVTGRYEESMTVTTTIDYVTGTETYVDTVDSTTTSLTHVEYIWAQQRITYLLKQVMLHGDLEIYRDQIVALGMQYGITVGGYTAMVLTAYDVDSESIEEGALDSYSGAPRAAPIAPSYPVTATPAPAAAALDPTLGIVSGALGLGAVLLVGLVFFIARSRRG
jgi:hypothetical protein